MVKRMQRRGQSTMEYLLVIIAVLIAVIAAINTIMKPKVDAQYTNAGGMLDKAGTELKRVTGVGGGS